MVGLAYDYLASSQICALNFDMTFNACGSLQCCFSFHGDNLEVTFGRHAHQWAIMNTWNCLLLHLVLKTAQEEKAA